jgi:ABC-2 type transport system ATP-binding protein
VIIDHGQLIYDGGPDTLRQRYGGERTLVVDLEEPAPPLEAPGARVVRVEGRRQWLSFRRDESTAASLAAAVAQQAALVDFAVEEPDIEDVVRRIYTERPPTP